MVNGYRHHFGKNATAGFARPSPGKAPWLQAHKEQPYSWCSSWMQPNGAGTSLSPVPSPLVLASCVTQSAPLSSGDQTCPCLGRWAACPTAGDPHAPSPVEALTSGMRWIPPGAVPRQLDCYFYCFPWHVGARAGPGPPRHTCPCDRKACAHAEPQPCPLWQRESSSSAGTSTGCAPR